MADAAGLIAWFNLLFVAATVAIIGVVCSILALGASRLSEGQFPIGVLCGSALYLGAWFAIVIASLNPSALNAAVSIPGALTFPILFLAPIALTWALISTVPVLRRLMVSMPLSWSVGFQSARVIGGSFIVWASLGTANVPFALVAGIGDVLVGLTAPIAARMRSRPRVAAFWHAVFGLADFAVAISLAFSLGAGLSWPAFLIPLFLVPLAICAHIWTLTALWRTRSMG